MQRMGIILGVFVMAAGLGACGGDGDDGVTPDDAGSMAGSDGGGMADVDGGGMDGGVPVDGGDTGFDAGRADASIDLTFEGTVYGEGATDRTMDGGPELYDGGAPDGAVATPGGRIIGARVALRDLSGALIDETTTDGLGEYALTGPAGTLTFLQVEPIGEYAGSIRAEATRGDDYVAFDVVLQLLSGLDEVATAAGTTRDATTGWLACGINAADPVAGGEGVTVADGIMTGPIVNLTPDGVIETNRLPPICTEEGENPPGARDDATCIDHDRSKQIFITNVEADFAEVIPLDPETGTCGLRFDVDEWLLAPSSLTVVNVDCMP